MPRATSATSALLSRFALPLSPLPHTHTPTTHPQTPHLFIALTSQSPILSQTKDKNKSGKMTDMGIPYDTKKATEGMAEGKTDELQKLHSPGEGGVEAAKQQHAHATSAAEGDPPVEQSGGHHGHRGNPKK